MFSLQLMLLLFYGFRPSFPRSRFLGAPIRSSTTTMSTSHLPRTSSPTWSPTASTRSGWPVTAARVLLTGRPGWSSAPNKEVRPPSVEVFVGVWTVKLPPLKRVGRGPLELQVSAVYFGHLLLLSVSIGVKSFEGATPMLRTCDSNKWHCVKDCFSQEGSSVHQVRLLWGVLLKQSSITSETPRIETITAPLAFISNLPGFLWNL